LQPPANPALAAAVKLLAEKRYTKVGLAEKLRSRGYAPDSVQAAIGECERRRFLDDRTFAQLYVKSQLDRKSVGRLRLQEALLRQGVSEEIASEVLSHSDSDEDTRIDLALDKLLVMRPHEGYAKIAGRLERLGFGAPGIARALRRRASASDRFPDGIDFEEIG